MKEDKFKMKDGRIVKVDFTNTKSCLSISKEDWQEIHEQLIMAKNYVMSKKFNDEFLKQFGI